MSRTAPGMRDFAERLIAYETKAAPASQAQRPAALLVFEKLRLHLKTLMGNVGFRALLSRSLVLARIEVSWLRSVSVNDDGSFNGLEDQGAQAGPEKLREASVILLTGFLGLVVTFIGENLTQRLVRQIWPKLPLGDLVFSDGERDENPKQRR